jgi:RNA polymerase sigma-70 factor (ECF subfamily)
MSDAEWDVVNIGAAGPSAPSLVELVERHDRELVGICIVAGATRDVAREAVQNTWVRAATRLHTLREPTHVRRWLIAIAINEVRQLWRRHQQVARHSAPLESVSSHPQSDPIADPDLAVALSRLHQRDRELLSLTVLGGLNSAEAGKIVGLTAAGVRTRKARIVTALRKELEDDS